MEKKYKIAYISGTRADYGIVRKYLKFLSKDERIVLDILVTGAHLDERFGHTVDVIRNDGFNIEEFPIHINNESTSGVIASMSEAILYFGNHFQNHKYDLVILLGDRYEILSASIAAAMQKNKILHFHGGEITLGNYDEFIRHSITKISTFHFTSTEEYRKRVIQLGEDPERVFNMGSLGAENAREIQEDKVEQKILALPKDGYFTVLYHPETLTDCNVLEEANTILSVMSKYSDTHKIVLLGSNADTGGNLISQAFMKKAQTDKSFMYFESLSPESYLYLVKNSLVLIGNSSSGIIEAPSLGNYTINIGRRQDGRIRASSVLDVNCTKEEIDCAISKVMEMKKAQIQIVNPYFKENAAQNCYYKTLELLAREEREPKRFFDLFFNQY